MIDSQTSDIAVSNFLSLESQLRECLDFIPFMDANQFVVSPKFIPIILESCSLIDSIFRDLAKGESLGASFKHYSHFFEPRMELEESVSLFLAVPIRPMIPFKGWTTKQPEWWSAYNQLKHDRLANFRVATITSAASAMAALHQVIARSKDFALSLLRAGWIDTHDDETVVELGSVDGLGALHPGRPAL